MVIEWTIPIVKMYTILSWNNPCLYRTISRIPFRKRTQVYHLQYDVINYRFAFRFTLFTLFYDITTYLYMCESRLKHLLAVKPPILALIHSVTRACDFGPWIPTLARETLFSPFHSKDTFINNDVKYITCFSKAVD